jgi:tetratricopeptide (TPR) repeat protein
MPLVKKLLIFSTFWSWSLIVFLFSFLFSASSFGETIQLKSGAVMEGRIIELTDDRVSIDKGNGNVYNIDFRQIAPESLAVLKTLPQIVLPQHPVSSESSESLVFSSSEMSAFAGSRADANPPLDEAALLRLALQKEQEQKPVEAFYAAKKVLDDIGFANTVSFAVLDETLRLATDAIIHEVQGYNKPLAENLCKEQIGIIEKAGGLDKVIGEYRARGSAGFQEKIDKRLVTGYYWHSYLLIASGSFDEAEKDLAVLQKVSRSNAENARELLTQFKKLYFEDKDLLPLYKEFIRADFMADRALYMTNDLSKLYRKIEMRNLDDMEGVIQDLRKNGFVLSQNIFADDGAIKDPHENILSSFLGHEDSGIILSDLRESIEKGLISMEDFRSLFECSYCAYLSYFILKAKGLKIDFIYVREYKSGLSSVEKLFDAMGFKSQKKRRVGHALNLIEFNNKFVIVDLLNQHIVGPYSWDKDVTRRDGNIWSFLGDREYIKQFEVFYFPQSLAVLYMNFGQTLKSEKGNGYLETAIRLKTDFADAYSALGDRLFQQKNYDDAQLFSDKALEINPQDGVALLILSRIKMVKNDCSGAIEYAQRAWDAEPIWSRPPSFLAYMNYSCYADSSKAKMYLKKAIDLAEQNGDKDEADQYRTELLEIK